MRNKNKRLIPIIITMLILSSMACGISIDIPAQKDIITGETVTENIEIPTPNVPDIVYLTITFGAGNLTIRPNSTNALLHGTATYNAEELKPIITSEGNIINIKQGNIKLEGFPDLNSKIINNWDLGIGSQKLDLQINAGAYKGDFDFGNLSISNLTINEGAAMTRISFSEPNKTSMKQFRYETGASEVSLYNLANANFENMSFQSGAGTYFLDFGGELKKDISVSIESGISSITINVPDQASAEVAIEGNFTNIEADEEWIKTPRGYKKTGGKNTIFIFVELNAGNLTLSSDE